MRPLPRLFAVTTDTICRAADFGVRAAALAAAGPAAALVVRAPDGTTAQLAAFAERVTALARPPEAAVFVHARPDLARAVGAQGVQLRRDDLSPADARLVFERGWIGVSVHGPEHAESAIAEGADYLMAGNVFETASHPGRPARGLEWLAGLCRLGRPVVAIGGITPDRVHAVKEAGAWGAAAITALWDAADPAAAALAMVSPWIEEA
ncbi:MAG TPA: thiamine phosphate synthase [Gemmatimonadales bacterium]|nr:thiamine phosphate synthase [Gemmatimonadales bacterium]